MTLLSARSLRNAAGAAVAATAIAVLALQGPASAGVWTLDGAFSTYAQCEQIRQEFAYDYGFLTQPCTYRAGSYAGWYFKHMEDY